MHRVEITHGELADAISQLGSGMNTNVVIWMNKFTVMIDTLDKHLPGFKDDYQKEMFRQQCYTHFLTIERPRRGTNPDALEIIKQATGELEQCKKLAKERNWLSAYNKASRDAAHYAEEEHDPEPPKLEVVE